MTRGPGSFSDEMVPVMAHPHLGSMFFRRACSSGLFMLTWLFKKKILYSILFISSILMTPYLDSIRFLVFNPGRREVQKNSRDSVCYQNGSWFSSRRPILTSDLTFQVGTSFFGLGKWLSFSKIYLLDFGLVDFYHEALQKVCCAFSMSLVAFRFLWSYAHILCAAYIQRTIFVSYLRLHQ